MAWTLEVPWVPASLNRSLRSHWARRKSGEDSVAAAFRFECRIPVAKGPRRLRIERHAPRLLDPFDNLPASYKALVDALVREGILTGDSAAHGNEITATQCKSKHPATRLFLEDIA